MTTAHAENDMAAARYDYFLGEVRAELARRRIRQTALAMRMGMSQQHLSARLSGHTPFKFLELIRLADALDMPLADLAGLSDMRQRSLTGSSGTGVTYLPAYRTRRHLSLIEFRTLRRKSHLRDAG